MDMSTVLTKKQMSEEDIKFHFKLHSAAVAGGTNRNENKGATLLCLV